MGKGKGKEKGKGKGKGQGGMKGGVIQTLQTLPQRLRWVRGRGRRRVRVRGGGRGRGSRWWWFQTLSHLTQTCLFPRQG